METPYRDERGVDAHYAAVWGALNFVAEHREAMITDQVEIFKRGFLDQLQQPIPDWILDLTDYEQYNDLTTMDFPTAYVIPVGRPLQRNPEEAMRLVNFLLRNDVTVEVATGAFDLDGTLYPAGTYVVWLQQPKRGLANTVLWAGWDISYVPGLDMYDISGWSLPLSWGVTTAQVMAEEWMVSTHQINKSEAIAGSVENGKAAAYAFAPQSNAAVKAANELLQRGVALLRAEAAFSDAGRAFDPGTFVMSATEPGAKSVANELASGYGLEVYALTTVPAALVPMKVQKLAVIADEGTRFVLGELGFTYDVVSTADLNNGVLQTGAYDVLVNSSRSYGGLNAAGKASVQAFVAAGGDYVGIGRTGVPFASPTNANLLVFSTAQGTSNDNGVLHVTYDPADPAAAGYPADSYGFVYGPLWFTSVGPEVDVAASVGAGGFFVSGYWANWMTSGAAEKPIVVHGAKGTAEITLLGLSPAFRAHPEHTFRLLANAVYNGLD